MIDPQSVLVITPSYDGKHVSGYSGGLASCASNHLFANFVFIDGCSDIRLARNLGVHRFLNAPRRYEWLLFIDADIAFTARDIRILLDYQAGAHDEPIPPFSQSRAPTQIDGHDAIVVAEYARKVEVTGMDDLWRAIAHMASLVRADWTTEEDQAGAIDGLVKAAAGLKGPASVAFGLGFARIHRSALEQVIGLTDESGAPQIGFFREVGGGPDVADIFPTGPSFHHLWQTEDHGFFMLAAHAGIIPRRETRTRLHHMGQKDFPYPPAHALLARPEPVIADLRIAD